MKRDPPFGSLEKAKNELLRLGLAASRFAAFGFLVALVVAAALAASNLAAFASAELATAWCAILLAFLACLLNEGLVDVWDDTTAGNGGLNQAIEFLITTNGELKVSWCDTFDLQVLGSVTSQLEDLGSKVLKNGARVHGSGRTDTVVRLNARFEITVNTTDGELKTSTA